MPPLHTNSGHPNPADSRPWPHRRPFRLSTFSHEQQVTLDRSVRYLQLHVDYASIDAIAPAKLNKDLTLADGLAYILHLQGKPTFEHTRSLHKREVVQRLTALIPAHHFVAAGVPSTNSDRIAGGAHTHSVLQALDASSYFIEELEAAKANTQPQNVPKARLDIRGSGEVARARNAGETEVSSYNNEGRDQSNSGTVRKTHQALPVETKDEVETMTAKTLRKMDQWSDLWLNGDLEGDGDWETFKDCLDLPD